MRGKKEDEGEKRGDVEKGREKEERREGRENKREKEMKREGRERCRERGGKGRWGRGPRGEDGRDLPEFRPDFPVGFSFFSKSQLLVCNCKPTFKK